MVMGLTALDADATRIEYYATVAEPTCELNYAKSGLGYCDVVEGFGDEAPLGELIIVSLLLLLFSRLKF
jgi:peptidylprolyl isomerase